MARPKIEIDEEQVFKLAQMMCTHKEIAAFFDCSTDTIADRFSQVILKGHEVGRMSLRRKQWKLAEHNAAVAIWLGKQYLGQKDKIEHDGIPGTTVNVTPGTTYIFKDFADSDAEESAEGSRLGQEV